MHRIEASEQRFPLITANEAWRDDANCRVADPDLFFPINETSTYANQITKAREKCLPCLAKFACLSYALKTNQPDGIWGGLTTKERSFTAVKQISSKKSLEDAINKRLNEAKR